MSALRYAPEEFETTSMKSGKERREHRRHDFEHQGLKIDRWDGSRKTGCDFGRIVDLSAGGVRVLTEQTGLRTDNQIRIKIELPDYAGISPFVDTSEGLTPKREWVGWMAVTRVRQQSNGETEIAGRLVDMDEIDRGMLGLYLSTQPLAA